MPRSVTWWPISHLHIAPNTRTQRPMRPSSTSLSPRPPIQWPPHFRGNRKPPSENARPPDSLCLPRPTSGVDPLRQQTHSGLRKVSLSLSNRSVCPPTKPRGKGVRKRLPRLRPRPRNGRLTRPSGRYDEARTRDDSITGDRAPLLRNGLPLGSRTRIPSGSLSIRHQYF